MQKFNIVTPGREYKNSNGETKREWLALGKAVYFPAKDGKDAGLIVDWNTMPGKNFTDKDGKMGYNNPVVCFIQKPKESTQQVETTGYDGNLHEPIKDEDIAWS